MKLLTCIVFVAISTVFFTGCSDTLTISEEESYYRIPHGMEFWVKLQTHLSSETSLSGDTFTTVLSNPLTYRNKSIVKKGTVITGTIKKVVQQKHANDQAALHLVFNKMSLSRGGIIHMIAHIDTDKDRNAILFGDKYYRDVTVKVGTYTAIGGMMGKANIKDKGAEKGVVAGGYMRLGSVIMANKAEVRLEKGTEIRIKLDQDILIPKIGVR